MTHVLYNGPGPIIVLVSSQKQEHFEPHTLLCQICCLFLSTILGRENCFRIGLTLLSLDVTLLINLSDEFLPRFSSTVNFSLNFLSLVGTFLGPFPLRSVFPTTIHFTRNTPFVSQYKSLHFFGSLSFTHLSPVTDSVRSQGRISRTPRNLKQILNITLWEFREISSPLVLGHNASFAQHSFLLKILCQHRQFRFILPPDLR